MAQFKDIRDQEYYKKRNIPAAPKPEIHFYPDITDEALLSGEIDIEFTLSYRDVLDKIHKGEDDIHTPQMAFANPKTADTHTCFLHQLDLKNGTQKIALIDFAPNGEVVVKEWI